MARCRRCGEEAYGRNYCGVCLKKWSDRRTAAFDQAVSEIGPLSGDTLVALQKRVKQLETQAKREERRADANQG